MRLSKAHPRGHGVPNPLAHMHSGNVIANTALHQRFVNCPAPNMQIPWTQDNWQTLHQHPWSHRRLVAPHTPKALMQWFQLTLVTNHNGKPVGRLARLAGD